MSGIDFIVRSGEEPIVMRNFKTPSIDETVSFGLIFLRSLGITVHRDFDRMQDSLLITSRTAPFSSLSRNEISFDKRFVKIPMPEEGTPERAGFDAAVAAICGFVGSHK